MPNLSIGIIGLPNAGKSTLFRALTSIAVPAENYPFCTIDPNVGVVEVPDERLRTLARMAGGKPMVPAVVEFVDIAGLVRGASQGEGLGNRFLHHVREADALAHVVRAFQDVTFPAGSVDPTDALEVVHTELALADLEVVERRLERLDRQRRSGDREAAVEGELLERMRDRLALGTPARSEIMGEAERTVLRSLNLLTLKPTMYVVNVDESALRRQKEEEDHVRAALREWDPDAPVLAICARLEAELLQLPVPERAEFMAVVGVREGSLDRLIRAGYALLGLETFFTLSDNEVRAWTVRRGVRAPQAAGKVHTDFERGFIRAETIQYSEFVRAGSLREARSLGRVRSEGKDYVVQDGDILLFRTAG